MCQDDLMVPFLLTQDGPDARAPKEKWRRSAPQRPRSLWEQPGGPNDLPGTGPDVLPGTGSDGRSERRGKGQSHTVG